MSEKEIESFLEENRKQIIAAIKDEQDRFESFLNNWSADPFHWFTISMTFLSLFFLCLNGIHKHHWTVIVGAVIISILFLYFVVYFFGAIRDSIGYFIFNNFFVKKAIVNYLKKKNNEDIENLFIKGMTETSRSNKRDLEELKLQYCLELFRINSYYEYVSSYIEKEYKSGRLR